MIPQRRFDLPFVDQPRRFPRQYQCRVHRRRQPRVFVDIQQRLARRRLPGHRRFSAGPRSLYKHRAGRSQPADEFYIADSRTVRVYTRSPEPPVRESVVQGRYSQRREPAKYKGLGHAWLSAPWPLHDNEKQVRQAFSDFRGQNPRGRPLLRRRPPFRRRPEPQRREPAAAPDGRFRHLRTPEPSLHRDRPGPTLQSRGRAGHGLRRLARRPGRPRLWTRSTIPGTSSPAEPSTGVSGDSPRFVWRSSRAYPSAPSTCTSRKPSGGTTMPTGPAGKTRSARQDPRVLTGHLQYY